MPNVVAGDPIRLNLGCGDKPRAGWINIDNRPLPGVNIVRDILRGLPFADNSVVEIFSDNFLEHLPQTEAIWAMNEMHRVLVDGGLAVHIVPSAGSVIQMQDPTHLSQWHKETFTYFEWSHARNAYYGNTIKPWSIKITTSENGVMGVEMIKVVPTYAKVVPTI